MSDRTSASQNETVEVQCVSERRHRRWFLAVAMVTFLADQLSKTAVRAWLPLGTPMPVIPPVLYLNHTKNMGAAFGLFPNATMLFIVVAICACALFLWLGRRGFDRRRIAVGFGLMLGGAIGNLIDRLRFGAVTDFIDLQVWPVFNLADTALTFGALLLLWWGWQKDGNGEKEKRRNWGR